MKFLKRLWPYLLILAVVLFFFNPIFKGYIPFPGDLLINQNPYKTESYLGFLPSSYPNKAQGPDVINEIYPWKYFSIEQVKNREIPFWNPHNFSGNPQMANFQTAIFYPLNLLYLVFPFNISWAIFIMLQSILAAVFMYLFLNKGLSLRKFASTVGGIAFAFSSYMVVWIEYGNIGSTLLWLPLALLLAKNIIEKNRRWDLLFLTITLVLSFLAGYIQGVFYLYTVIILYFLFLLFNKKVKQKLKKGVVFFSALIFPVFLVLFQLLPTLELFGNSTRGSYSLVQFSKLLSPVYYWITIVFPDFFGNPASRNYWFDGTYIERVMYPGTVVFLFAILAVLKVKTIEKKFFAILAAFSLIIATNLPCVKYFYQLPIPVISTTVPTRELSIFLFCIAVLSAMGINFWMENKIKTKFPVIFFLILLIAFPIVFLFKNLDFINDVNFKVALRNMILPTALTFFAIISFYLKDKLKTKSYVLVLIIIIFELFYFFNKITPFAPSEFTYSETPVVKHLQENAGINRFWGYGSGYIAPNYQSVDGTYSPEGNDPLHISCYGELLASSKNAEIPEALPRPDANVAPGFGNLELKNNPYRQKILNLLGIKYILHKDDLLSEEFDPDYVTFPEEKYELVWQDNPWQIYENKEVLPRYFLASNYKIIEDKDKRLNAIYDKETSLQKTVILEEDPGIQLGEIASSSVELLSYNPNKISFKINTDANSLFFISDNYFTGWKALVDEKEVKIYKANYSFRAVPVEKGTHKLEMYYYPESFSLGLRVSIISLFVFLIYITFFKKLYEKK